MWGLFAKNSMILTNPPIFVLNSIMNDLNNVTLFSFYFLLLSKNFFHASRCISDLSRARRNKCKKQNFSHSWTQDFLAQITQHRRIFLFYLHFDFVKKMSINLGISLQCPQNSITCGIFWSKNPGVPDWI